MGETSSVSVSVSGVAGSVIAKQQGSKPGEGEEEEELLQSGERWMDVVKMERRGLIWLVVRGWRGMVWSGMDMGMRIWAIRRGWGEPARAERAVHRNILSTLIFSCLSVLL